MRIIGALVIVLITLCSTFIVSKPSFYCASSMNSNKLTLIQKISRNSWISVMTGMAVMMTPMISIIPSDHHHHHQIYINNNRAYAYEGDDIARFTSILSELEVLDNKWDSIVLSKGDNIRRKLGTVYTPPLCASPLCGVSNYIPKYVKTHYDDLDVVSFEDPSSKFLQAYNQADFLAYSSMFADYGNGGGTGIDYIELSHEQVKKAIEATKEMIQIIRSK